MDVQFDGKNLRFIKPLMERYCTHHGLDYPILAMISYIAGYDGFDYSDEYIEDTIVNTAITYALRENPDSKSDEFSVIYDNILYHLKHKFRTRTFSDSDFSIKTSINCLYRLITDQDNTVDLDVLPEIIPDGTNIHPNDVNVVARHVFLAIAIANKLNKQCTNVNLHKACYFYSDYDE